MYKLKDQKVFHEEIQIKYYLFYFTVKFSVNYMSNCELIEMRFGLFFCRVRAQAFC